MTALLDLETKLTVLALNPCACQVCAHAARLAKRALADVSPSSLVLLDLKQGSPEFAVAEAKFHADEIARLSEHYDYLSRGRCQLAPEPKLDTSAPQPTPPATETYTILTVDDPVLRDKIEFYRKHSMKPRMMHRRTRIEMKKNPRIPGSYIIK